MQTILPGEIEDPYQPDDSRMFHMEGSLIPLGCDFRKDLLEDLNRRGVDYVENTDVGYSVLRKIFGESIDTHGTSYGFRKKIVVQTVQSRLHYSKVSGMLRDGLAAAEYGNGFLLVVERFGAFYMSALASRLAFDRGAVTLSNKKYAFGFQIKSVLDGVV